MSAPSLVEEGAAFLAKGATLRPDSSVCTRSHGEEGGHPGPPLRPYHRASRVIALGHHQTRCLNEPEEIGVSSGPLKPTAGIGSMFSQTWGHQSERQHLKTSCLRSSQRLQYLAPPSTRFRTGRLASRSLSPNSKLCWGTIESALGGHWSEVTGVLKGWSTLTSARGSGLSVQFLSLESQDKERR